MGKVYIYLRFKIIKIMTNIIGVYECKADTKSRLMFPAALKKQLSAVINNGFVIKKSVFNKCLELYPVAEWNKEIEKINKLNRFIKKNNDFIRIFMAGVRIVELDINGRLLIPKDLIKFSEIKKNIVLSSAVNRIEIWDKDKYEKIVFDKSVDFGALAEEVMGDESNS